MKLVLVIDDESWFWVYDPDLDIWNAWYEEAESPASRARAMDRATIEVVMDLIRHMTEQHAVEANVR